MGQKDKASKFLEAYNDVFADIFNVLVFDDNYIDVTGLSSEDSETQSFGYDGNLHSSFRDCIKRYHNSNLICVSLGIENQTTVDNTMPVRMMGYDYNTYMRQLQNENFISPVLSLVLYFGENEWETPLSLTDMMTEVDDVVLSKVNDYPIQIVNMRRLTPELCNRFQSDFSVIADFFAGQDNDDYYPVDRPIRHTEAVLHFLSVFTGDARYRDITKDVLEDEQKGQVISLCKVIDRFEQKGIEKGIEKGIKQGIKQGVEQGLETGLKTLVSTLKSLLLSFDDIYEKVMLYEVYQNYTRDDVKRIYEEIV